MRLSRSFIYTESSIVLKIKTIKVNNKQRISWKIEENFENSHWGCSGPILRNIGETGDINVSNYFLEYPQYPVDNKKTVFLLNFSPKLLLFCVF